MILSIRRTAVAVLLLGPLVACASYQPIRTSVPEADASLPSIPEGPLDFERATRLLVRRHPALRAARAEIRAVNTNSGPRPLVGRVGRVDGDITDLTLETDILSLFGMGLTSAQRATALAQRDERVRRYQELARDLVGELAEAYVVERVLSQIVAPAPELDIEAFRRAGITSEASLTAGEAALAEASAESRVLAAELADARRRIVELTGAAPGEAPEIVTAPAAWPPLPAAQDAALLLSRGDLLSRFAELKTADQRFRQEVVRQYPDLELRLGGNIELDNPLQLLRIRLPLDAGREAKAARHAREAAHERLRAGVLAARHDVASRHLALDGASADVEAARSRRKAATSLFAAERARVETDSTAFTSLVLVVSADVAAARNERRAAVAQARARVRAARAAGWPAPASVFVSPGGDS